MWASFLAVMVFIEAEVGVPGCPLAPSCLAPLVVSHLKNAVVGSNREGSSPSKLCCRLLCTIMMMMTIHPHSCYFYPGISQAGESRDPSNDC